MNVNESNALESVSPLNFKEFAQTFSALLQPSRSNEYDCMIQIAQTVFQQRNVNERPVRLLSVGAGTGSFEKKLVQELGLKLEFIYAVEPNPIHVALLQLSLEEINCKFHIDTSFFHHNFKLDDTISGQEDQGFDIILMSQCLYTFDDPLRASIHSLNFLKTNGSLFIINQGDSACSEIFGYLLQRSDPSVFNVQLAIQDHTLTANKIASYFASQRPDISVDLLEKVAKIDIDQFIRADDATRYDDIISFFLQAEYRNLSKKARKDVYDIVSKHCEVIGGRYFVSHSCVGIVISNCIKMTQ